MCSGRSSRLRTCSPWRSAVIIAASLFCARVPTLSAKSCTLLGTSHTSPVRWSTAPSISPPTVATARSRNSRRISADTSIGLRSPALVADGKHLWTDVVTSAGVAAGVLMAMLTGWWVLDPLMAAAVAAHILWSGSRVVTQSLSGLMDEAVSQDLMRVIRETIADRAEGAIEAHDLRTRQAGSATFIDFHLVVDGATSVSEAHQICDRIETALKAKLTEAQITIHVEPDNKAKHAGILVL